MSFLAALARIPPKAKGIQKLLCPGKPVYVPSASSFWEPDKKGGYETEIKRPVKKMVKDGLGELAKEIKLFGVEMKDKFELDQIYFVHHMDYAYFAKFDNQERINSWVVSCDKDHNEGKSEADFVLSKDNNGLFHGRINTEVPKDGKIKKAGYVNMRSPRRMKSFKRSIPYDYFADFTHLVIRCRGDGRPYMMNLAMDMYYDINWNDQFSYPLFTRGGPYWQTSKIPFSKFFRASKGRIQDKQEKVILEKVAHLGFTCADQNSGPFLLEIDYIMLLRDENHSEDFAYESYETTPGIVGC
ncbi:complex I intermediate-associated protein 30, mitochondrial-like [Lineus longissimus]|uniref:complex I intermediate-associated protein 30, mitochondrial-like n=1 Tax=Lineus longissimus TaxID=88925 RepID=UPI002B4E7872